VDVFIVERVILMNKKGFTLVELLAVIAILSIIITLVATNGFGVFENSKKKIYEENEKAIYEAANVFSLDINHCEAIQDEDTIKTFFDTYDLKCSDYIRIKDIIKRHGINSTNINNLDDLTTLSSEDKTLLSVVKNKGLSNDDETNLKICFDIPLKFLIDNNYLENDGVLEINKMYPEFKVKYCNEIIAEKTYINLEKGPTIDEIEKGINILYVDQKDGNDTNVGDYNAPLKSLSIALEKANDSEQFTIKLKSDYTFQSSETIENNKNVIIDGNNKNMVFNTVNEDFYITNKSNMIFKNIKIKNGGKILKNLSGNLKIDNIVVNNLTDTFLMNNAVVESISNSKFNNNHFELTNEEILEYIDEGKNFYDKSIIINTSTISKIDNCKFENNSFNGDDEADSSYSEDIKIKILELDKALCILNKSKISEIIKVDISNNIVNNNNVPLIINFYEQLNINNSTFKNNSNFIHNSYFNGGTAIDRGILVVSYGEIIIQDSIFSDNVSDKGAQPSSLIRTRNGININGSKFESNNNLYYILDIFSEKKLNINETEFINNDVFNSLIDAIKCNVLINKSKFYDNKFAEGLTFMYNTFENQILSSEFKNNTIFSSSGCLFASIYSENSVYNIDKNTIICGIFDSEGDILANRVMRSYPSVILNNQSIIREYCE